MSIRTLIPALLLALGLAACGEDTKEAWEDAGEATDRAIEETGEEIQREIHEATEPEPDDAP